MDSRRAAQAVVPLIVPYEFLASIANIFTLVYFLFAFDSKALAIVAVLVVFDKVDDVADVVVVVIGNCSCSRVVSRNGT